jgi:hypothetical protein
VFSDGWHYVISRLDLSYWAAYLATPRLPREINLNVAKELPAMPLAVSAVASACHS